MPDDTTLYNSVAQVFVARYNRVNDETTSRLSPESQTFCTDDHPPVHSCELRIDVPLFPDQSWAYDVRVAHDGCWTAQTSDRYGANQGFIDDYRSRSAIAPTTAEVRRYIRDADRLRSLKGCASNVAKPKADGTPESFIAGLAAQNVQRERPGHQAATTCHYLGKQAIALAPDSYDFECTTTLAAGRAYVDKIICFDPPPYTSFDSCSEEDGYPRRPPRELPK